MEGYTAEEGAEGATAGDTAGASATIPQVFFVGEDGDDVAEEDVELAE